MDRSMVNDPELRSHSGNEHWRRQPCLSGRKILLPGKGVREMDNELEPSAGQHTFFAVRRLVLLAIPELLDIWREGCDRLMADDHAFRLERVRHPLPM